MVKAEDLLKCAVLKRQQKPEIMFHANWCSDIFVLHMMRFVTCMFTSLCHWVSAACMASSHILKMRWNDKEITGIMALKEIALLEAKMDSMELMASVINKCVHGSLKLTEKLYVAQWLNNER